MNIGLVSSFVIAGILLLSILSFNMNVSQNSTELVMQQVIQRQASTLSDILQKDISNIASNSSGTIPDPITDARKNMIVFKSDIDNNGSNETITWEFTNTKDNSSSNPSDYLLIRKVDGNKTEFRTGITNFELTYYDQNRDEVSTSLISILVGNDQNKRNTIRYIDVKFTIESKEKIGGAGIGEPQYIKTFWSHQFTPLNLSL